MRLLEEEAKLFFHSTKFAEFSILMERSFQSSWEKVLFQEVSQVIFFVEELCKKKKNCYFEFSIL